MTKEKKKDKEITITDIAGKMDLGFKANDSKFDELTKTIDDLASATADGFLRMEKRFGDHDKRFESIDKRFNHIGVEIKINRDEIKLIRTEMSAGLSKIKDEIKRLDGRIDKLLKMTNEDIASLVDELNSLKLRVKKLELKNSH